MLSKNRRARRWHTAKRRLLAAVAGAAVAAFEQERGRGALGDVQGDVLGDVQHASVTRFISEPFSVVYGERA